MRVAIQFSEKYKLCLLDTSTPLPPQKGMVELGLLVYSVAMSGVWLRTYQGCVGEKDDGHLIIYDFGVYDSQKTDTRFGARHTF